MGAYLAKSMEIAETIAKQDFRENVPLKHFSAALAKAFVNDSDLMQRGSSTYPPSGCIAYTSVEAAGKKLLECMEATPSEENAVPLPGYVYLGNKEWGFVQGGSVQGLQTNTDSIFAACI